MIDIWLNLKENENTLSFAKNGKRFDDIKVEHLSDYKLAIGMFGSAKKVKLLSFEIVC